MPYSKYIIGGHTVMIYHPDNTECNATEDSYGIWEIKIKEKKKEKK